MSGQLGLALVVANVLVDQLGLPIPAIPTLVVAGAVAADRHAWGVELFVGSVLACVIADSPGFSPVGMETVMSLLRALDPDSCVSETSSASRAGGRGRCL